MNPTKALNLAIAATFLLAILAAGYGLYERGKQAERAETAEQALVSLKQAYTRSQTALEQALAADSVAEEARLALREPVEPTVTRFITLTDTLAYTDTIIVEAAREAVTTCSLALLACEARISTSDSVRAALEAQIRLLQTQLQTYRNLRNVEEAGRVPTWTLPIAALVGAGAGAWIRGQ
jgi:hypothetical protein